MPPGGRGTFRLFLKYRGNATLCKKTDAKQIIVATELGIIHRLQKENPGKQFISISEQAVCMTMKMIELEDVRRSLVEMTTQIELDDETIRKAKTPIIRMIEQHLDE